MDGDTLLTVPDVAALLKVREETVREWLRKCELSGYNFGGRTGWRVPRSEVEGLLNRRAGKRPPNNTSNQTYGVSGDPPVDHT